MNRLIIYYTVSLSLDVLKVTVDFIHNFKG